jgi:hypothetical protein
VRDAAVELIGKYMIESPEVVGDYYAKIADRIAVRTYISGSFFKLTLPGHGTWSSETRD